VFTADIRAVCTADPAGTAGEIVEALLAVSPEFGEVWRMHEVDVTRHHDLKRYRHPELGELELYARRLVDPDEAQDLLVFWPSPARRATRSSASWLPQAARARGARPTVAAVLTTRKPQRPRGRTGRRPPGGRQPGDRSWVPHQRGGGCRQAHTAHNLLRV